MSSLKDVDSRSEFAENIASAVRVRAAVRSSKSIRHVRQGDVMSTASSSETVYNISPPTAL